MYEQSQLYYNLAASVSVSIPEKNKRMKWMTWLLHSATLRDSYKNRGPHCSPNQLQQSFHALPKHQFPLLRSASSLFAAVDAPVVTEQEKTERKWISTVDEQNRLNKQSETEPETAKSEALFTTHSALELQYKESLLSEVESLESILNNKDYRFPLIVNNDFKYSDDIDSLLSQLDAMTGYVPEYSLLHDSRVMSFWKEIAPYTGEINLYTSYEKYNSRKQKTNANDNDEQSSPAFTASDFP